MTNDRLQLLWWLRALLAPLIAMAACSAHAARYTPGDTVVTPQEVADAIRASPNSSPWLVENADAVAALAMFESGGHTSVYNGSCCYGVLQMNTSNIDRFASVSPEEFRNWSLQQQVDAWAKLTSPLVNSYNPQRLIASGTFDGRGVDGNLILACIQLGVGNCGKMIDSGHCGGFRDKNKTSICDMADAIATGKLNPNPGGGGPGPGPGPGPGHGNPGPYPDTDFLGSGLPITDAIRGGFEGGAGVSIDRMRTTSHLLLLAIALLIIGSAMIGVWRHYANGAIASVDLIFYMKRALIIVGIVAIVMAIV